MKKIALALLTALVAACAPEVPPAPTMAPAAPPPPAAAAAAASAAAVPPSEAQVAPGHWDVVRVRCSDLLNASDADRGAVAMFYYGYLAARDNIRVINVKQIDDNLKKVMNQCESTPKITVVGAFEEALR